MKRPIQAGLAGWGLLLVILLLTVLLTVPRLGLNLTVDEPYSANLVRLSFPEIWQIHQRVGYEVTYHLLLKPWVLLFGDAELALRSLSLVFYLLTILVMSQIARKLGGQRAAWLTALLFTLSPDLGLVHAANARPYALLGLQVALATLLTLRLLRLIPRLTGMSEIRLALVLTGLHVLGLMNHPLYGFFIGASVLSGAWISRRAVGLLALCGLASVAFYLLLWWPALQTALSLPLTNWIPASDLSDLLDAFSGFWGREMSVFVVSYAVVVLALRAARGCTFEGYVPVSLTLVAVSALAPLLVSQVRPIFVAGRTPMLFYPIACLLAGVLIARWGSRLVTGIIVVALANVTLLDFAQRLALPDPFPTAASVRHVIENATCVDTVILASLSYSAVDYYWHRLGAPACIARESFPLSTQSHPGWMDIPSLTSQRDELAAEATATTHRLAQGQGTVWLFYLRSSGAYRDLTDILKLELDRRLALVETLKFRGLYFDSILVYSASVTEP